MDSTLDLPNSVRLVPGPGGLPRFEITTPLAEAHIHLHGAHVTHFAPAGNAPLLFVSAFSDYQNGKPIRGGVPVIFPWFGPRAGHPTAPAHGFARTSTWAAESVAEQPDGAVVIVLRLDPDEASQTAWDHRWVLRHRITVGTSLTMALEIENLGATPFHCEEALHTYFRVSDVRNIEVLGLENAEYLDKADGMRRKRQSADPIQFTAETDRTYVNTSNRCVIADPGLSRRIVIEKSGSQSTIVWNPWIAKARAMADFGEDEWPFLVCVETGNVADNTLEIAPANRHVTTTTISLENSVFRHP